MGPNSVRINRVRNESGFQGLILTILTAYRLTTAKRKASATKFGWTKVLKKRIFSNNRRAIIYPLIGAIIVFKGAMTLGKDRKFS